MGLKLDTFLPRTTNFGLSDYAGRLAIHALTSEASHPTRRGPRRR
jgi:hypothetical protein